MTTDYPWFQEPTTKLQQAFEQNRLPHSLLLIAPTLSGKAEYSLSLAKRLLCESQLGVSTDCNQCKSCLLMNSKTHPDFYYIDRLIDNKGKQKKSIGIEQIRQLTEKLVDAPQLSGWRVAIISSVTAMTRASFNALLKTLEEPKDKTLLILLADNVQKVPATIKSRCQMIVPPLTEKVLVNWLISHTNHSENAAKEAIKACYSAPLAAKSYLENNGQQLQKLLFSQLDSILSNQLLPEDFLVQIEIKETQLADTLATYFYQVGCAILVAGGSNDYQNIPAKLIFNLYTKVLEFNRAQHSGSNLQIKLQIKSILIQWFEIGRKISHYSKA